MEITEVRIKLMEEASERLQAFCSITFDNSFVIRDLKIIDGVKVMHLTAGEVEHEFVPGSDDNGSLRALCWGYNGQVHGPTIECLEGDRLQPKSLTSFFTRKSLLTKDKIHH